MCQSFSTYGMLEIKFSRSIESIGKRKLACCHYPAIEVEGQLPQTSRQGSFGDKACAVFLCWINEDLIYTR